MKTVFMKFVTLHICIKIKAFNRIKRKQQNILKIFLDYLKNHIVAY